MRVRRELRQVETGSHWTDSTGWAHTRIGMIHSPSITDLLAALSEPTRLAALGIIWDGQEHCVCELMDQLGASQSRMSRHMARLKTAGLLTDRRDAQWVRYRRNPDLPPEWVAIVDAVLAAQRDGSPISARQKAA